MPFETTGLRGFLNSARDMRLLISIDTVMKFADVVRRQPTRYGLKAWAETNEVIQVLVSARDADCVNAHLLRRSDGQPHRALETQQLALRFEMAYNPNDCIELVGVHRPTVQKWNFAVDEHRRPTKAHGQVSKMVHRLTASTTLSCVRAKRG